MLSVRLLVTNIAAFDEGVIPIKSAKAINQRLNL
jgi:hypothetical protein